MVLVHNTGSAGNPPVGNIDLGEINYNGSYTFDVAGYKTGNIKILHKNTETETIDYIPYNKKVDLGINNEIRYIECNSSIYKPNKTFNIISRSSNLWDYNKKQDSQVKADDYRNLENYIKFGSDPYAGQAMFPIDTYHMYRYAYTRVNNFQAAQVSTTSYYTVAKPGLYLLLWMMTPSFVADPSAFDEYVNTIYLDHQIVGRDFNTQNHLTLYYHSHTSKLFDEKNPFVSGWHNVRSVYPRDKGSYLNAFASGDYDSITGVHYKIYTTPADFQINCNGTNTISTRRVPQIVGKTVFCLPGDVLALQMATHYGLYETFDTDDTNGYSVLKNTTGIKLGKTNTKALTNFSRAMSICYLGPGIGSAWPNYSPVPGPEEYHRDHTTLARYCGVRQHLHLNQKAEYFSLRDGKTLVFDYTIPESNMYWLIFCGKGGSTQAPKSIIVNNSGVNIYDITPVNAGDYTPIPGDSKTAYPNLYIWDHYFQEGETLTVTLQASNTGGTTGFFCYICTASMVIDNDGIINGFAE